MYQEPKRDLAALQAVNSEEERLLQLEQDQHAALESFKQEERDCFEGLSDAIQASHEKERAQSERMKYYSRLGSVLGAVFGFLGSNLFLKREIRRHNQTQAEKMLIVETSLQRLVSSGESSFVNDKEESVHATELREALGNLQSELLNTQKDISALCSDLHGNTCELSATGDSCLGTGASTDLALVGVVSYAVLCALIRVYYN